jgi:transposase
VPAAHERAGGGPDDLHRHGAAVGDGEVFARGRDVGAWWGLVPRQYSTGGKPILGRISKQGDRSLRTLFIQAAKVILMRPHNGDKFSCGAWLTGAATRLHKNKLATALANKLARISGSVLRHGRAFDTHREVAAI